jgi:NAD+ synthase (glutamine-hydrolysing)
MIAQCVRFDEDFNVLDLESEDASVLEVPVEGIETIRRALVLGIKDFVAKTGFQKVHFGLSGGIDSAVVACLAADAIGPMNVHAIGLRGPFTSPQSVELAKKLAENLHIGWSDMSIEDVYSDTLKEFERVFGSQEFGVMNENIQARLRGLLLMAYSNKNNSLLMGTSNKTELAVGYATLYGDMCAGIMPIGDLLKTQVYELARHYNAEFELIPQGIIDRPASAELRAEQKTEESLLPFKQLDPTVQHLVEELKPPRNDLDRRVLGMLFRSEFKRWQAAPILKVSNHAFGRGRRLPIAHQARI